MSRKILVSVACALFMVFMASQAFAASSSGKIHVTVGEFQDNSQDGAPAKAIQDMMAGELARSGKFSVIERARLDDIAREQRMSAQGLIESDTAVQQGHIKGAKYLITGSITEYHYYATVAGLPIGNVGIGGASEQAHVTIDMRVVDNTTSEIVMTSRRTGVANQSQGGLISRYGGFATGKVGGLLSTATYKCVKTLIKDLQNELQ